MNGDNIKDKVRPQVSVVIVTYNPNWISLQRSVLSVLGQKNIDVELIITDDASKENYFAQLKQLFESKGFEQYHLVGADSNNGTVSNLLKGVLRATGLYLKPLGQGDMLANEYVLSNWFAFCEKNRSYASFGNVINYCDKGKIEIFELINTPHGRWLYEREWHIKSILNEQVSYLLLGDLACGASWIAYTDVYKKYVLRLKDRVIFGDDNAFRLMAYDGVRFDYYPQSVIWYEYGCGMSTCKEKTWGERLKKDIVATNLIMGECSVNTKFQKKYLKLLKINGIESRMKRAIIFPKSVLIWLINKVAVAKTKQPNKDEVAFYEAIELEVID